MKTRFNYITLKFFKNKPNLKKKSIVLRIYFFFCHLFIFHLQLTHNTILVLGVPPDDQTPHNPPRPSRSILQPFGTAQLAEHRWLCAPNPHDRVFATVWAFAPFTFFTHPPQRLPSGNCQNVLCGSVSVLLLSLFCFLDSMVDGYVFYCSYL